MTGHLAVGSPIEVCRPVVKRGRIVPTWIPATVEHASPVAIVAVFADFSRREYQPDAGYVIREASRG